MGKNADKEIGGMEIQKHLELFTAVLNGFQLKKKSNGKVNNSEK